MNDSVTLWPLAYTTLKRINRALADYDMLDADDGLVTAQADLVLALRNLDGSALRTAITNARNVLRWDEELKAAIWRLDGNDRTIWRAA